MGSATGGWEHRIGARRECDRTGPLCDFHRISCERSLELFGDLDELLVFRHRHGSDQAQRECCCGDCDLANLLKDLCGPLGAPPYVPEQAHEDILWMSGGCHRESLYAYAIVKTTAYWLVFTKG